MVYLDLKRPVFLVVAERFGIKVLRLMLDHHPAIAWRNEFEYAIDMLPAHGWPELQKYYDWLATHHIFQASGAEINETLDYPSLVNDFFVQHRERTGKPIIGAKVNRRFERLRIWLDALSIRILRDSRDVACSEIGMGWTGNPWSERWIESERLWEHLTKVMSVECRVEISSKNLLVSPKEELTRICEFLGLSYTSKMMNYV
ncbi:MAG: sulfotransferase [Cyanobacteria bacterium P01_F01_bin.150]